MMLPQQQTYRPRFFLCIAVAIGALFCPISRANAIEIAARGGLASAGSSSVRVGPSFGLAAGVPISSLLVITAAADHSIHRLAANPDKIIDATTAQLGLEARLDFVPVVPFVGAGPAFQYAARRDKPASDKKATGYLAFGLQAVVLGNLQLGCRVTYLLAGFASSGLPSYKIYSLQIGWSG